LKENPNQKTNYHKIQVMKEVKLIFIHFFSYVYKSYILKSLCVNSQKKIIIYNKP